MEPRIVMRFVSGLGRLQQATRRATSRWLHRVGGYARKVAKNSLKRARPKRSDEELTDYELDRWVGWMMARDRQGLGPPPYPDRTSKPGQPPLLHMKPSPLKFLLRYHADVTAQDVVIGPERARSGIVNKLEHGSATIKPRPFMAPAEEKTRPHLARWWQDAIT